MKIPAKIARILLQLFVAEKRQIPSEIVKSKNEKPKIEIINEKTILNEKIFFINNAGIVLLSPYFPRLFSLQELFDEKNNFKNREAQIRAMFLMQFAIFGKTEFPEHEMILNKILTNFETGKPIPRSFELTENEKNMTNSMLNGALQNWKKLSGTSVEGLRQSFLQRQGKLTENDAEYALVVEAKSFDMLLDSITWSYNPVFYSWMKKPINIKWR
jgi:hypothetical protein